MESCKIIKTLRVALENNDVKEILRVERLCIEKIKTEVVTAGDWSVCLLEKDAFSTATITENIKNVVLGDVTGSNKQVVAAR